MATRLGFSGLQTDEVQTIAHGLLHAGIYDDALLAIIDADVYWDSSETARETASEGAVA